MVGRTAADALHEGQVFIDDDLMFWRVAGLSEALDDRGPALVRVQSGASLDELNHLRLLVRPEFDALVREKGLHVAQMY